MNLWTTEEITKILTQLDSRKLPFKKYAFSFDDGRLIGLGHGGSADVYAGVRRRDGKGAYAIKVIGFRGNSIESDFFQSSVNLQETVSRDPDNRVVPLYDYSELWVTLDEHDNVTAVSKTEPKVMLNTSIKLQFIVMQNLPCVISRTKDFNIKLTPDALAKQYEDEVIKLAYDIGTALRTLHRRKVLHRDVKLENVFYNKKDKSYRLGDFGIARKTYNGFASTVAFTKGYVAPEVLNTSEDDSYDNTADIYSFGMMLYVLMNGMKFPDSSTYNVNFKAQYSEDYTLPRPEWISDEFFRVIEKMCMYNPDDRYQSMDEVMLDVGKLRYGGSVSYKMEHNTASLLGGLILFLGGIGMWKFLGAYHWLEAVLISFGAVLLLQYVLIRENDAFTYKIYFKRQIYWIVMCAGYLLLPLSHLAFNIKNYNPYRFLFGNNIIDKAIAIIEQYNLDFVGLAGLALCAFWLIRECILRTLHRK